MQPREYAQEEYEPPELNLAGLPAGAGPALMQAKDAMTYDIGPYAGEWDAIVCASDFHGVALAAVAAAHVWKTLVVVTPQCNGGGEPLVIGHYEPGMRLMYADDFFRLGASKRVVQDWVATQPGTVITATYAAQQREYLRTVDQPRVPVPGSLSELARARDEIVADLLPSAPGYQAIVCAWDPRGTALAAIAAASLGKVLVIVHTAPLEHVVSHIVPIGDFDPRMKLLFMCAGTPADDALSYMRQSEPCAIIATYDAHERAYLPLEAP